MPLERRPYRRTRDRQAMFRIFRQMDQAGGAVLLDTHDRALAACTERLLQIREGRICEDRRLAAA